MRVFGCSFGGKVNRRLLILIAIVLVVGMSITAAIVHKRSVDAAVQHEEELLRAEAVREQQQVQPLDPPATESKVGRSEN